MEITNVMTNETKINMERLTMWYLMVVRVQVGLDACAQACALVILLSVINRV
jgi:hypothetical protein